MKLIQYGYPRYTGTTALDRFFELGSPNFRRFSSFFDQFLGDERGFYEPAVDLYEDDQNYYVRAELPGVAKNQIELQLESSVLTLRSTKSKKVKDSESQLSFTRSVSVPDGVAAEKVVARYEDGVLTVTLPKAEVRKPRQIAVN